MECLALIILVLGILGIGFILKISRDRDKDWEEKKRKNEEYNEACRKKGQPGGGTLVRNKIF